MTIKSIHKRIHSLACQQGYARLTGGTLLLTAAVLIPLIYHVSTGYRFSHEPQQDIKEVGPTSLQVFPQTIPVLQTLQYLLEVTDQEGKTYVVSSFLYQSPDRLTDKRDAVFENGVINLPEEVESVSAVRLSLYDDSDPRRPVVIPFLQGAVSGDRALLNFVSLSSLREADGGFMLATPTDNNSLINERSGVWFGNVYQNTPLLQLPALPSGWIYEGWAVTEGRTLTTGKFTNATRSDLFSGFSDTKASAPGFPGEDFLLDPPVAVFPGLTFPLDLASQSVMITLEPSINGVDPTGAGQFQAPVLSATLPRLSEAGKLYELDNVSDSLPKATVVLR